MGKSISTSNSSSSSADNKVGAGGDLNAPVAAANSSQANAEGSVAFRAGNNSSLKIDNSTELTDNTNNGTQFENVKLGNGSSLTIENLSDDVALGAITAQAETAGAALQANIDFGRSALTANRETSLAALQTNKETTQSALNAVLGVSGDAFDFGRESLGFGRGALDSVNQASRQQYAASLESINASNQTAQQAAAASESIVKDALGKLADQRAPEGTALTKALTIIAIGALLVWGLVQLLSAKKSAKSA
jgi:hypothetical protein